MTARSRRWSASDSRSAFSMCAISASLSASSRYPCNSSREMFAMRLGASWGWMVILSKGSGAFSSTLPASTRQGGVEQLDVFDPNGPLAFDRHVQLDQVGPLVFLETERDLIRSPA